MIELFLEKKEFFFDLLLEHIQISAVSILIAIVIGLFIGILISEYKKTSKFTLSVISFLYTIQTDQNQDSMYGKEANVLHCLRCMDELYLKHLVFGCIQYCRKRYS